ncbi:MAG: TRAP transporter large permease subunit, partial [Clostridia bacterium]|nr:TRAP transporter large permease subunit [Clostridia bacterium]
VSIFIILGTILAETGGAKVFISIATALGGKSVGGPAKVAVIGSSLFGMVSGSASANGAVIGAMTIPMMKKSGYDPTFSGAVTAVAATGGGIMPPIMGAAAFLMVEYTGMQYGAIAVRAILPAALYFSGIFILVHLEAKKLGLQGVPREQLPKFFSLMLHKGYLLLPLIALVYFLVTRTMAFAALAGTILAILVSMIRKDTRINIHKFFDALENVIRLQRETPVEDIVRSEELNYKFHEILTSRADNSMADLMLELIHANIDRYLRASFYGSLETREVSIGQHEAILAACRKGDFETACNVLRDHILNAKEFIPASLK